MIGEIPGPQSAHQQILDGLVDDLIRAVTLPVSLNRAPWPLTADDPGVGDDVHRALLADDWADSGMKANQLKKLIEVQVVARKRQYSGDHPGARDLGICVAGHEAAEEIVGRLLVDLDDDNADAAEAAITLVDIAVHPQRQRQGIGSEILRSLLATAAQSHRAVHLSAVFGTPALRWYEKSGFIDAGGDALYRQLVWHG